MSIFKLLEKELRDQNKLFYYTSDKREFVTRCVYCGDSVKDQSHAHFYISTDSPYKFFCQRCESKGILNDSVIKDFSIDNGELLILVSKSQKEFFKNTNKTISNIQSIDLSKKLKVPKIDFENNVILNKIKYIESRVDKEMDRNDLIRYKFIPSIENFIILNNMNHIINNDKLMKFICSIDKNTVPFLSADNSHLNCRFIDTTKSNGKRYAIVKLDENNFFASKAIAFRCKLDIMSPSINLVQTEGIFDLISVYENFYKGKDLSNTIFWAVCGKGFKLIPTLLNRLGFLNINLHHFSDNDIKLQSYEYIFDKEKLDELKISYNTFPKEKDFGVPRNRINLKTFILKN